MAERGRGKKMPVDFAKVEAMAQRGCSDSEIAHELGCSRKTIERLKKTPEYDAVIQRGYARGRVRLRSKLFQLGIEEGNVTALIWLSKQKGAIGLGFTDRIDTAHSGPAGGPIPLTLAMFDAIRIPDIDRSSD
jgi:hypothetical protein